MTKNLIAIIGGSGFYNFLENAEKVEFQTPFSPSPILLEKGTIKGREVVFLPRHGTGHSIPPHMINHRANIFALHSVGVTRILTTNAVGSVRKEIKPGDFVITDQFIDPSFTPTTFFDGSFKLKTERSELSGVVHTDMTEPYCGDLRQCLQTVLKNRKDVHPQGTYVMLKGPRFETRAEIQMLAISGGDLAGMTSVPELVLARELGICYGNLCIVTNYAAGLQETVNHEEVMELFNKKINEVKEIIRQVIEIVPKVKKCKCPQR